MNLPRFTGEASLYQTNAHYRTGSHVIHSSAERVNPIYSAMEIPEVVPIIVPPETVVIIGEAPPGCPPGYTKIGGICMLEGPSPGGMPGDPSSSGSEPGGMPGDPSSSGSGSGSNSQSIYISKEAKKVGSRWNRDCHQPDGAKWLSCCREKATTCVKAAKKDPIAEAICVEASAWCKGTNPNP